MNVYIYDKTTQDQFKMECDAFIPFICLPDALHIFARSNIFWRFMQRLEWIQPGRDDGLNGWPFKGWKFVDARVSRYP